MKKEEGIVSQTNENEHTQHKTRQKEEKISEKHQHKHIIAERERKKEKKAKKLQGPTTNQYQQQQRNNTAPHYYLFQHTQFHFLDLASSSIRTKLRFSPPIYIVSSLPLSRVFRLEPGFKEELKASFVKHEHR